MTAATTAHNRAQAAAARANGVDLISVVNLRQALLFAAGLYVAIMFLDSITRALLLFLTAFLIAIVLNAPVRALERRGIKRGISAAGVALVVFGGLGATAYFAGPPLLNQATALAENSPKRIARLRERTEAMVKRYPVLRGIVDTNALKAQNVGKQAGRLLPRVGKYTLGMLGSIAAGFILLVIALYTLAAPQPLLKGIITAVPPGYRRSTVRALTRITGQIEEWALASLILMVIVGVLSGLGLWLIGVPNPILFGIIAGFGEGVPTIGPILSAIPPMLVSLADAPDKVLWVAVLFLVVQQIENNILVPMIMASRLNLHPVSILFFVLALGAIVGLLGAILAVPAAIITKVCFEEFYAKKRAPRQALLNSAAEQVLRAGTRPRRRVRSF